METILHSEKAPEESTADKQPKQDFYEKLEETCPHDHSSVNLDRHYGESLDYLDDNFAYFVTHVLNMGRPQFTSAAPTADVSLPMDGNKLDSQFRYRFNPRMAKAMTVEEQGFVMAHETFHILLRHLNLIKAPQFQDYIEDKNGVPVTVAEDIKGPDGSVILKKGEKVPDYTRFNIAADCVINDYLVNMGLEPGRFEEDGMFGPKVVGYDCSNSTVTDVHKDVPKPPAGSGVGPAGSGGIPVNTSDGQGEAQQNTGEGFDDHGWMQNPSQGQEKAQDKIGESAKGQTPQDLKDQPDKEAGKHQLGKNPGSGVGGELLWAEEKGVSLRWIDILKKVNPEIFHRKGTPPRPDWTRMPRKLMGVNQLHPDLKVPAIRKEWRDKGEQPLIVMALDTSGSCAHYANRFITLAKSIPQDKLMLKALTFTTAAQELDLDDPKYRSGGTSFGCIEQYIQDTVIPDLGHYPKAVVIITDGAAGWDGKEPEAKLKDRWLWMLTDRSYADYCQRGGTDALIDDFIQGDKKFDEGI